MSDGSVPWRLTSRRVGLFLLILGASGAVAQIVPDGRSGRVSPFRGGQTTFMFRWDIPEDAYSANGWLDQPQALGSPFGLRTAALDHGITLAATDTSYTQGNVAGGAARGAAYLDDFFVSAIVDLGKLWRWNGWSVAFALRQTEGGFLGDIVGTTPITSPGPEPNRAFRFGEMALTWEGFNQTLQVSAGRLILNNVFAQIPQVTGSVFACRTSPMVSHQRADDIARRSARNE